MLGLLLKLLQALIIHIYKSLRLTIRFEVLKGVRMNPCSIPSNRQWQCANWIALTSIFLGLNIEKEDYKVVEEQEEQDEEEEEREQKEEEKVVFG